MDAPESSSTQAGASAPHQLANEMTPDASVQATDASPETRRTADASGDEGPMLPRVERRVGLWIVAMVLGAVVLGLMLSAIILQQLTLLAVGAVFIIPFLLLVSAPVWLASATKQAQDETVRELRQE